jgi:nitrite reductase/ring-hydroxylating ferredoxin subunit
VKLVARLPRRELEEGILIRIEYPPFDVVVTLVDGKPYAIEDACNHAGASLAEGGIQGDRIMCPMHGYVFSMKSGELLAPEGLCGPQRTFQVVEEGDEVAIYDRSSIVILG